MHGELVLSTSTLFGFLLTLTRVSGVFVFVPLPGLKTGFDMARVVLSFVLTMSLFPYWPQVQARSSIGLLAVWVLSEAALGIGIGLAVAFVTEAFGVAAQMMGLQAGYAYASTIDPNTQADSSVLVIFSQLAVGLLFFATGLNRQVLRIFAESLTAVPAGSFLLTRGMVEHLLSMGGNMFSTGVRLALPVVAVLIMVDISLALLGRINAHLQLLTVAFPIKMLLALSILGWVLLLMPTIMRSEISITFSGAKALFVH
jgi:flagellar biosynthesis protein FliR